ncbi:nucleotidyltransferase domain-containing protein [Candidatus Woesearchaeota archaeon]|nr:MAG: nucleotidyltransferase domain-containing protein [Candidatus Woesearchaeota archaeon]
MTVNQTLKEVNNLCKPLTQLHYVKAVWVYGSALRKKELKKTSDIDILVLIDDTLPRFKQSWVAKVNLLIELISMKALKKGLKLHFQPPKKVTLWWELLMSGEPWVITSLRNSKIFHDPSGYISLLKKLLIKRNVFARERSVEKLIERSSNDLLEVKHILLNKLPQELLMITTETAQRVLAYHNRFPITTSDTVKELKKVFAHKLISKTVIDDYEELCMTVKKINKGALSEFTGRDFDRYYDKIMEFIKIMEKIYEQLEEKKIDSILKSSYLDVIRLANKAVLSCTKKHPKDNDELLKLFNEKLVKKNIIDEVHLQTLKELISFNKTKNKNKIRKERYLSRVYINSFEIAVNELLEKNARKNITKKKRRAS